MFGSCLDWFWQVKALIKLKECEDTHLGEEVDRNWGEVLTQQYLFDRLEHEVLNRKGWFVQVSEAQILTRGNLFGVFL